MGADASTSGMPADATTGERVATGVEGLDRVLGGGLPAHRLYLVQGSSGLGKTTLGLQFLLEGVRRGERVLCVTLSETRNELEAIAASHGWSMDGIETFELSNAESLVDADSQYTVFHPSEVELSEMTRAILERVERLKPSRVVFDSLSEFRLLASEPLRFRRQMLSLKHFFAERECSVLLLDDFVAGRHEEQLHTLVHGAFSLSRVLTDAGADHRRLHVVKLRGVAFREGYHEYRIITGGLRLYPALRVRTSSDRRVAGLVTSGVAELDDLLGGGIDQGTSTLIVGPAGVGKSTIAAQYAIAGAERGERSVVFLFEESPVTLLQRTDGLNMPLRHHVKSGAIRLEPLDPIELTPGGFSHAIRQTVEGNGTQLIAVDTLSGYFSAVSGERHVTLRLHELLSYLMTRDVTSLWIVGQPGLFAANDLAAPMDVSYLADNVLLMRYFEFGGTVRQAISVFKRRGGRHERTIRELKLGGKSGVDIGEPLTRFHGVLTGVPRVEPNVDRLG